MLSVLLASGDAGLLAAWHRALRDDGRCYLPAPALSLPELRRRLQAQMPSVLVLGLRLQDVSAADAIQVLRLGRTPPQRLPILVVSAEAEQQALVDVLLAGADSVHVEAQPQAAAAQLPAAVHALLAGEPAVPPWVARYMLQHFGLAEHVAPPATSVEDLSNPLNPTADEHRLLCALAQGASLGRLAREAGLPLPELGERLRALCGKMRWGLRAGTLALQ